MNDDLRATLRAAAAERAAADRRWEDRARGTLAPEHESLLRDEARTDEEAALLYQVTEPVDPRWLEAVSSRAEAAFRQDATTPLAARRGRGPRIALVSSLVAAAAVAVLWIAVPRAPRPLTGAGYAWTLEGVDVPERGNDARVVAGRARVSKGAYLHFVAQPSVAITAKVVARAFTIRGDVAQPIVTALAPSGSILIEGKADDILGPGDGEVDLVVFVGAESAVPADANAALRALRGSNAGSDGVEILRVALVRL